MDLMWTRSRKAKFSTKKFLFEAATKGSTTCHSLRQPVFVGHRHSGRAQRIGMKLKECSNLFYSLETREDCQSYSKHVYCPELVEKEERNEVCYGSLIPVVVTSGLLFMIWTNMAQTFLSRLLSMNWKAWMIWKRGEQSSEIRKSTTLIQNLRVWIVPIIIPVSGLMLPFAMRWIFIHLGYSSTFRSEFHVLFHFGIGREEKYFFYSSIWLWALVLPSQSIGDIDNRPEGQLESRFSSRSSDRPLRNTINYKWFREIKIRSNFNSPRSNHHRFAIFRPESPIVTRKEPFVYSYIPVSGVWSILQQTIHQITVLDSTRLKYISSQYFRIPTPTGKLNIGFFHEPASRYIPQLLFPAYLEDHILELAGLACIWLFAFMHGCKRKAIVGMNSNSVQ